MPVHRILVGSYTNDITTLDFDTDQLTLDVITRTTVGHHPSWLVSHPSYPSFVWTGLEQFDGKILALTYDKDGKGKVVSESTASGRDPCHLLVVKDELLISNYSSGIIGSFTLSKDSPKLPSSPKTIQFHGAGPNRDRQEASHPHQVYFIEEYQELLVPDLGTDSVYRLKKADDGSWKVVGHIGYEAGGGPRHVIFHHGELFTILELSNKVVRHKLPALPGLPKLVASKSTMSAPLPLPKDMLAAEILLPPPNTSFPIPYLYLSNRNDPSPEGDIISIFSIENTDGLELVAEVRTGLNHVRGMVFGGADDKFLIAGGATGGNVKVFERINGGKALKEISSNKSVEGPTGFLWL